MTPLFNVKGRWLPCATIIVVVLMGCGRRDDGALRLKSDSSNNRSALFGISIDSDGNVDTGRDEILRAFSDRFDSAPRARRDPEAKPAGFGSLIKAVRSLFDNESPPRAEVPAIAEGRPLTTEAAIQLGRFEGDTRRGTRSGKTNETVQRFGSYAEARATIEREMDEARAGTERQTDEAQRAAQLINDVLSQAAQSHNFKVNELLTDAQSLAEALKSLPQDTFRTPAQSPNGLKVRQLQRYVDQRMSDVSNNNALPKATKDELVTIARTAARLADEAYVRGDVEIANAHIEYGFAAMELAAGVASVLVPGVGLARDVYEAAMGVNLLSGERLSGWERTFAVVGVLTGGVGSQIVRVAARSEALAEVAASTAKALGSVATGDSAEEIAAAIRRAETMMDSAKNIRSQMSNLGEVIPGTLIPKYFRLKLEGSEFFVNPNATKHMGEYIKSLPTTHNFPLRNDLILASFEGSVRDAIKSGAWKSSLDTGNPIISGGWELIISKRPTDELPVIKHALMGK